MADLDHELSVHPDLDIRKVALDEGRLTARTPYPAQNRRFDEALKPIKTVKPALTIKTVCVYCGSSPGTNPAYVDAAKRFGALLAQSGVALVYGGGGNGIMGTLARAVLSNGGHVTGIIPDFLLAKEGDFREVSEHHVVPDMHKRKMMMFERADAFVAFPGGVGTLEEIIEVMTWAQLGRHGKPIVFANINNFWQPLLALLNHMRHEGFIRADMPVAYKVADGVEDILVKICEECFPAPTHAKDAQIMKKF